MHKSIQIHVCVSNILVTLFYFSLSVFVVNSGFAYPYKQVYVQNDNLQDVQQPKTSTPKQANNDRKLYLGLGVGKPIYAFGKIKADYTEKTEVWLAPGSFAKSKFDSTESLDIQLLLGTQVTNNFRLDFNYLHYSNLSLKLKSHGLLQPDEKVTSHTGEYKLNDKPDIHSDVAMLNFYYYLDRFIGTFKIRPYISTGVGLAQNIVSDYIIVDRGGYIIPGMQDTLQDINTPILIADIKARHKGSTVGNFVYSFELGVSYNLTTNSIIDIFGRYVNLGTVESEGIVSNYNVFNSVSNTIPVGAPYNIGSPAGDATSFYPDWEEKGKLSIVDIGLKIRFLF